MTINTTVLVKLLSVNLLLPLIMLSVSSVSYARQELAVAVGLAKPPYVIQENDSGFEIELIRNVFELMGYSTKFVYTTFGHSPKMLNVKEIDAVMTTNNRVFKDESKLSNIYVTYQNVAISLKESNLAINAISDLSNYSIAAFQKADKVLGNEYANAIEHSPIYLRVAEQKQQPVLLLKKRVQVLIMDRNIFNYLVKQMQISDIEQTFTIHPIFPETHYKMAFKNPEHRSSFNQMFDQYRYSDDYQILKKQYDL
ncbi:polar amino acid ABC transporter [Thalassotalea insulae]|uniref:Polar amino acid ABC transporter n=1 Tax=Thalassotalea insulae TaxID=2056778 RepID=A0ABQ6GQY5_9GAMM|nr:transporter substrate-binding domain-containing protein [Thalassotalea insulae]GLX76967.1 polar amino acid ABC transporter [Thalassotalea insulae]